MSSHCVRACSSEPVPEVLYWAPDGWSHCLHKASSDYSLLADVATNVSPALNLDLSGFLYGALGPQRSVFIMITVQWGPNNNQMLRRLVGEPAALQRMERVAFFFLWKWRKSVFSVHKQTAQLLEFCWVIVCGSHRLESTHSQVSEWGDVVSTLCVKLCTSLRGWIIHNVSDTIM